MSDGRFSRAPTFSAMSAARDACTEGIAVGKGAPVVMFQ
jgi:hypothetical protein